MEPAALFLARLERPDSVRCSPRPVAPCWRSPMWRSQAEAEGLTLLKAENTTGYFGVHLHKPGQPKPYGARVKRGGKLLCLGYFATAEEAALCVARSPEGRKAAEPAASVPQPRRCAQEDHGNTATTRSRAVLKQEGTVPPMPPGAFVKEEEFPPMPPGAFVKEEIIVKREHENVVDEGGRSDGGRLKRRKNA